MKKCIKKLLAFPITVAVVATLQPSASFAQDTETGTVAQIFACQFNPGKDMSDIEAARDSLVNQIAAIGSADMSQMTSFIWWPAVTESEFDTLWFDYYPNLNVMGRGIKAYRSNPHSQAVEAQWAEVSQCSSSIHLQRQVYSGGELSNEFPALVQAFRCAFNEGMDMGDVEEALEDWAEINTDLGNTKMDAYMFTPLVSASPFDVAYFNVFDSWEEYASTTTNYLTSSAGQEMDERWLEIHRCENSLWNGQRMIPPLEQ